MNEETMKLFSRLEYDLDTPKLLLSASTQGAATLVQYIYDNWEVVSRPSLAIRECETLLLFENLDTSMLSCPTFMGVSSVIRESFDIVPNHRVEVVSSVSKDNPSFTYIDGEEVGYSTGIYALSVSVEYVKEVK